jgi:hypothetical protein
METSSDKENLEQAGMEVYQYIVDHCDTCCEEMDALILKLRQVDTSGQFLASTARYLAAVDRAKFEPWLGSLIEGAIDKDRERRYIGSLLQAIWGDDFELRVTELNATDNNFRRIYKRMHPEVNVM